MQSSLMPKEVNLKHIKEAVPACRYDGSIPFEAWQKTAEDTLRKLLGLNKMEVCPLDLEIEYEVDTDTYHEIRFKVQSEPGYFVPCHLCIPLGAVAPLPAVICLQGHSKGMHISLGRPKFDGDAENICNGDRDFANRVVKEGYCAVVVEQRNFGECGGTEKGPDCYISSMTALLVGRTTIGERVWDISRVIDVLQQSFPQINPEMILCMGNSGGGTATYYAACIDKRIKMAMPSCAVCTYEDSIAAMYHCSCNFIPHIKEYFDMGDLAGLIAPRPLVVVSGKEDPLFPQSGVQNCMQQIRALYHAAGADENCQLVVGNGGHRFYADDAWPIMNCYIKACNPVNLNTNYSCH